jgi:GNAT superfamily N-acetyltransferase
MTPTIEYRRDPAIAPEELAEVFRSSGIRRPVDDLPRMAAMLEGADLVIGAYLDGRLVGVARALTDFCFCCYLSDVAVRKEQQRLGIGKELVARVQAAIGPQSMLLLLAAPEAMEYYPRIGFQAMPRAWMIDRQR